MRNYCVIKLESTGKIKYALIDGDNMITTLVDSPRELAYKYFKSLEENVGRGVNIGFSYKPQIEHLINYPDLFSVVELNEREKKEFSESVTNRLFTKFNREDLSKKIDF